jgi:hypothetical protein
VGSEEHNQVNEKSDANEPRKLVELIPKPTLCVDWDGVVHSYTSGWKGAAVIPDPPVPGALEWLYRASKLFNVVIYSTRSKDPEAIMAMRIWLGYHAHASLPELQAFELLAVVCFAYEKPPAFLTIDDRAICFDGDWSKLEPEKLLDFKPWNQRDTQKSVTE